MTESISGLSIREALTDEQLLCARGIMRRADRNAHGHIAQALRLKLADDLATFIATVGGAAVMAASAVLLGSDVPQRMIESGLATIGGVITLMGVWQAVWRPAERSRNHKAWAMKFSCIEDGCRLLIAGEGERTLPELVCEQLSAQQEADLVPDRYWRHANKVVISHHNDAGPGVTLT